MSTQQIGTGADVTIVVWDPLLRLFHWCFVTCFVVTEFFAQGDTWLHNGLGYFAGGLVAFRIVWGFIGPRHAQFSDFVPSPKKFLRYALDFVRLREPRTIGHNPLGGVMILGLLCITILLVATGWLQTTDWLYGVRWIQDLHETAADVALVMIGLHLAGVLYGTWRHKDNLIGAMLTGRKRRPV